MGKKSKNKPKNDMQTTSDSNTNAAINSISQDTRKINKQGCYTKSTADTPANKQGKNNIIGKKPETYTILSKGYKSRPCEFYKKGVCRKGNDCTYSHDFEVKTIEKICKFHMTNSCYKQNCLFSHDLGIYPCKFLYIGGKCDNGTECKYSHQRLKSKVEIIEFIKDNAVSIKKHLDNGISTPLTTYAQNNQYFDNNVKNQDALNACLMMIPEEEYENTNQIDTQEAFLNTEISDFLKIDSKAKN